MLREIGAGDVPSRLLLNKIDRVSEDDAPRCAPKHPDAISSSAKRPSDVAALRETIIEYFEASMVEDELVVPYAKQRLVERGVRERPRALRGLRQDRPDHEAARPARRHRPPAKKPRRFVSAKGMGY